MSNCLPLFAVALHPGEDFLCPEAPVLAEAVSREAVRAALSQMSIYPRDVDFQQRGYFLHGQ